jgi:hypothetical protein
VNDASRDDFGKFIIRIIHASPLPEEFMGKLSKVKEPTQIKLFTTMEHLRDDNLALSFDALIRYIAGVGQTSDEIQGHNADREALFIDAMSAIIPLLDGRFSRDKMSYRVKADKLAMMAGMLSSSKTKTSDPEIVRGFVLKFSLGFIESPDWVPNKMRFLGQHFDVIAEHWALFEERGMFDNEFIAQLASFDGTKPLSGGVL